MSKLETTRIKVRQLSDLINAVDPDERFEIRKRLINQQIRLAIFTLRLRIGPISDEAFIMVLSQKLRALQAILETEKIK